MARNSRYTADMLALIRRTGCRRGLNYFVCEELARLPEFASRRISARAIASKIRSLGLPYECLDSLNKQGDAIHFKSEIINRIEATTGIGGLRSLTKADKTTLMRLASALEIRKTGLRAGMAASHVCQCTDPYAEGGCRAREPENDS